MRNTLIDTRLKVKAILISKAFAAFIIFQMLFNFSVSWAGSNNSNQLALTGTTINSPAISITHANTSKDPEASSIPKSDFGLSPLSLVAASNLPPVTKSAPPPIPPVLLAFGSDAQLEIKNNANNSTVKIFRTTSKVPFWQVQGDVTKTTTTVTLTHKDDVYVFDLASGTVTKTSTKGTLEKVTIWSVSKVTRANGQVGLISIVSKRVVTLKDSGGNIIAKSSKDYDASGKLTKHVLTSVAGGKKIVITSTLDANGKFQKSLIETETTLNTTIDQFDFVDAVFIKTMLGHDLLKELRGQTATDKITIIVGDTIEITKTPLV